MFDIGKIKNTIIRGNSLKELKKIPSETIDLIFADPPYFMQVEGELKRYGGDTFQGVNDHWDKFASYKEYDDFCFTWLKECKRILKKDGSIWVIGSFQNIYRLGYLMQNLGFWIINDIVWSKPNSVPNFSGTRFKNSHETLLWCSKSKNSKFKFNYKTMKKLNNNIQEKSVWDISICIGQERLKDSTGKKIHSTQKPEKLLEKIILASTKVDDIILDPFFGTGTTGAVAKKFKRNFIGIESEVKYISAASKRIDLINSEENEFIMGKLEKKPPKVSLPKLLELNKLKLNEYLYDKTGKKICKVLENGKVTDHSNNQLSIHKMSAKQLKKTNHNGWEYFFVKRDNRLKAINDFRYEVENETRNFSNDWERS